MQLHAVVVDGGGADEVVDFGHVLLHGLAVVAGDEAGVGEDGFASFHVDEAGWAVEVEVELLLIEQMEDGDVVFAEAQVLDGGFQFGRRDE